MPEIKDKRFKKERIDPKLYENNILSRNKMMVNKSLDISTS